MPEIRRDKKNKLEKSSAVRALRAGSHGIYIRSPELPRRGRGGAGAASGPANGALHGPRDDHWTRRGRPGFFDTVLNCAARAVLCPAAEPPATQIHGGHQEASLGPASRGEKAAQRAREALGILYRALHGALVAPSGPPSVADAVRGRRRRGPSVRISCPRMVNSQVSVTNER